MPGLHLITLLRQILIALFALGLFAPVPAKAAADHVALIIGNSDYAKVGRLPNPANDAVAIAEELTSIGYDVEMVLDANYEMMRRQLLTFAEKASRAKIALVFYAGHGIEVDKQNYLIPVDAELSSDIQVDFQAIPLDMVLRAVGGASKLKVVLLDACRNNPFLAQMRTNGTARRSTMQRGLAAVEPDSGTLVGFAAKEGTTASDGEDRHSPYTAALLRYLDKRNLDVGKMFRGVRDDVLRATNNQQAPFTYGSLPANDVYLNPQSASVNPDRVDEEPDDKVPPPIQDKQTSKARAMWDAIKSSKNPADFELLRDLFPDTIYAVLARNRLAKLEPGGDPEKPDDNDTIEIREPEPRQWYLATYNDLDLFGGDIHSKGIRSSSRQACANSCGNDLSCRAFTYNSSAKRCFPKTGYDFAQLFSGAFAGYFFEGTSPEDAPSIRADWQVFNKQDLTGRDLGDSRARSFDACLQSCDRNSACTGVTYVYFTSRKQCWLKGGSSHRPFSNANARRGAVSAERISRDIRPTRVIPLGTGR